MKLLRSLFARPQAPSPADGRKGEAARAAAEQAKQRGNEHLGKGELDAAAECYREAVQLDPDYAEAYNNLAFVLIEQRRHVEAETLLDMALALKPDLGPAHLNQGKAAFATGKNDLAKRHFRRAAECLPHNAEAHYRLGDVRYALGDFEAAIDSYEAALAIEPELPSTRVNIGSAHQKLGNFEEAERLYRIALADYRQAAAAYFLGIIQETRYDAEAAVAYYREALALDPDYIQAHWNLALAQLRRGDYSAATWEHFERRLVVWKIDDDTMKLGDVRQFVPEFGPERIWQGGDLRGKRLLVWGEQGLGDVLMMLRYLPALKEGGASEVIAYTVPPLVRIVEAVAGVDRVIAKPDKVAADEFDLHVSMMSLPARCGAGASDVGGLRPPYLQAAADRAARWANRLAPYGGRKVGLVWGGNKDMVMDARRSVALAAFAPLLEVPGVTWVSLQKGEPASQLKALGWPMIDWMDECADLLDTAALVANLDLMISVDTAMVHLAGALGRPVWLLNRYESEWRWMSGREDSPWYPNVRLFNQAKPLEWDEVVARLRAALEAEG